MEAADRLTKIRRAFNLSDNEPIPDNIILNEINWNCKIHFYYEIHKIKSTKNTKIFQKSFLFKTNIRFNIVEFPVGQASLGLFQHSKLDTFR